MTFNVEFTARARRDLIKLAEAKNIASSAPAARWYKGLVAAVKSLNLDPQRCPPAPEASATRPVRQLLYGKKPHIYRAIFLIESTRNRVVILTIRHGAREPLA